jgi:hypothetical protein
VASTEPARIARTATLGGVTALVAVTALAVLGGASVDATLDANTLRAIHYVLVVALLGAGVAVAWTGGLRTAAAAIAVVLGGGVVTYAPTGYKPVVSLNAGLTVLAVLGAVLAGVEFAVRNPHRTRRLATSRAVRLGGLAGVGHLAVVFALRAWLGFSTAYGHTLGNAAIAVWIALGAFLVGTTVAALWVRHGVALPAVLVAGLLAWSVADTLPHVAALRSGSSTAGTLFTVYELGWIAVLAAALLVGGAEYVLKNRVTAAR